MPKKLTAQRGFSLLELSIILFILALLSGGLLSSLAAQREVAASQEAQRQLENIKEALLGHAIVFGRLPCPAKPLLASSDTNAGREDCSISGGHGVLPWVTLGLSETDPWGRRFSYYAHEKFSAALAAGALCSFGLDTTGNANIRDSTSASHDIASELPAVIVSHGPHGAGAYLPDGNQLGGASGDEAENADADLSFIAHTPTQEFDDQLTWIISSLLKSRLVAAGKLP